MRKPIKTKRGYAHIMLSLFAFFALLPLLICPLRFCWQCQHVCIVLSIFSFLLLLSSSFLPFLASAPPIPSPLSLVKVYYSRLHPLSHPCCAFFLIVGLPTAYLCNVLDVCVCVLRDIPDSMDIIQGFMSEVLRKYNRPEGGNTTRFGLLVYNAFQEAFKTMPLATLIEKNGRKVSVSDGLLAIHY